MVYYGHQCVNQQCRGLLRLCGPRSIFSDQSAQLMPLHLTTPHRHTLEHWILYLEWGFNVPTRAQTTFNWFIAEQKKVQASSCKCHEYQLYNFHWIGPLGRFSLRVAMSVYVCESIFVYFLYLLLLPLTKIKSPIHQLQKDSLGKS